MAASTGYQPWRYLALMLAALVVTTAGAFWPGNPHTPRLGLDLRGGLQVVLDPQPITEGAEVSEDQLQQSVEIIRQRVDGIGVAEAEISIQGSGNDAVIVVSVPGDTTDRNRIVELVGRTALLDFRPVATITDPAPVTEEPTDSDKTKRNRNQENRNNRNNADESTPADETGPADQGTPADQGGTAAEQEQVAGEIVQSRTNDAEFQQAVAALDCLDPVNQAGGTPDDPEQWLGTCDRDGAGKYTLEPAFIRGVEISSAAAELPQQSAGGWVVTLSFNSEGASKLAEVSRRLSALQPPNDQFAIVLDGVVVSAPSFREPILGGQAQIEGNFSSDEAKDLANVLRFGALPLTLDVQAVETVSPTLGNDQLIAGLQAGALGLLLIAIFLIAYYQVLGIVTIFTIAAVGWLTYCLFVIMGNTIGFTLTLAGIAGAIVSIGVTADSFIVFFERIRDEIRDGKPLRRAVDDGWIRTRRTMLAGDFVSVLAAVVLYFLSVGNVRGFAFALGLTTLLDVLCTFWLTRPVVTLIARTKWMMNGGAFTGLSTKRLGVESLAGTRRERGRPLATAGARRSRSSDQSRLGGEL